MRVLLSALCLVVAGGAFAGLRWLPPLNQRDVEAERAQDSHDFVTAIARYQEDLRLDSASPYRWADLGEAFFASGQIGQARLCFARARELGPYILPIWIRDANFHFQLGEPQAALKSAGRVLATVPDYDPILFSYFDRLIPDPHEVLSQIGQDGRASISYLRHLQEVNRIDAAALVWKHLGARKYADDGIAASYVDFLLRNHLYDAAEDAWAGYLAQRRGDYPARNLLFNGSYEAAPTECAFDWRLSPSDKVDTVRDQTAAWDGKWSMHVTFHGDENVSYCNVKQTVRVHPGVYRLSAWVRTDGITTNEGLRLRVSDPERPGSLDYRTESMTGTRGWTLVDRVIQLPAQTNIATVELCRNPSEKFDNKIAGSAWIDQIALTRIR